MATILTDINRKLDLLVSTKRKTLTTFGNLDEYMTHERTTTPMMSGNYGITRKRAKSETLGGDIFSSLANVGVMLGTLGLAGWVSNPKNKDGVVGMLKFGKGLFDLASNVFGFGANNLMDGISKVAGDKSILSKFMGGMQALVGFVSLRWLLNPLKIIKDIKSVPKLLKQLNNVNKLLAMSLSDVIKWSRAGISGLTKDISRAFSRTVLKVFGKGIWKFLGGLVKGIGKGVGGTVGKGLSFAGKLGSKLFSVGVIRTFGKFVSKIPIVGSLLGFGVNLLLGDSPQKAGFKVATGTLGAILGGLVGAVFPPAIPATTVIGGLLGDWLGDTLYDKFVPPKLASGGIVKHQSSAGTHVIVAEEEDEVVIPLSMLSLDGLYGSKFFEPIKAVGSNILGAIESVINTNNGVYSNISSDISTSLVSLSKTFGISTIISKQTSSGYIENNHKLTSSDNTGIILGTDKLSSISISEKSRDLSTNTTVRGLLHSILDVIVNPANITKGDNTTMNINNIPPAIVQTVPGDGTFIASGRATFYHPGDGGDPWGNMTSTGEKYSYTEFTAAALPGLINKLPTDLTVPVRGRDKHYKQSRTVQKPFMVKVVHPKTGKQAYVRINNVGQGGKDNRVIDFSSAPAKYFGGDVSDVQVYLAPPGAVPGVISTPPKFAAGGEYKFNAAPHKRHGGARRRRKHAGEDIDMRPDGTFQSWIGGTVVYQGFQPGRNLYGNYIDIYNDKLRTVERIAEAGKFFVKVGDKVTPGQIVSTGTSTGMIHYEIRPMDTYQTKFGYAGTVDPIKYLTSIGAGNIAGNTLKNNALASLVDNNSKIAFNNVPTNVDSSSIQPTQTPQMPVMGLGDAYTNIAQMLGVESNNNISPIDKYKKISDIPQFKKSVPMSLLMDGDNTNVMNIAHTMINQNSFANTRLRLL